MHGFKRSPAIVFISISAMLHFGCRAECNRGLFSNPLTYCSVERDSYGFAAIADHYVGTLTAEHGDCTIGWNRDHRSKAWLGQLEFVALARISLRRWNHV